MTNTEEEMLECPLCGHEFAPSTGVVAHIDGEEFHICQACRDGMTAVCSYCGERHPISELHYTEDYERVCNKCIEGDAFVLCEYCERYALRSEAVIYNDEWWGERCTERFLCECDECGDWTLRENTYVTVNGNRICPSCYDSDYVTCEECGNVIRSEDAISYHDDYYCEDCAPRRDGLYEYHAFYRGDYDNKKKIDGENEDLYLGIELECDGGDFDGSDFNCYEEIHFEEDGSLSNQGVEMISLPMTLKYHQRFDWEKILSVLVEQGFKSHNTDCCGLHVHMSRWAIPATTIAKMDVFINRAKEFWTLIARRDHVYNGNFDTSKNLDFTRCLYCSTSRCPEKMADKFDYGKGYDRYTPVNVCNRATVEIRIFRGTLKYQTFMGTIEICHAVVNWLNTVPVTRIYDTEKLIREFIEYLKHNKDRYPNVMPMLEVRFAGSRFERFIKENAVKKISQ